MTIQEIKTKAAEGGWKDEGGKSPLAPHSYFLEVKFWQGLGKTLGWKKECCAICGSGARGGQDSMTGEWDSWCEGCGVNWMNKAEFPKEGNVVPTWLYRAHQFFDHIMQGGDPESFFTSL